jgi:xanthine dehydrogenase accessory factor
VASRKRAVAVREGLAQQGLTEEQLRRFKSPAGLDIGARRGDEIALSIMAEIVQQRRAMAELGWPIAPAAAAQPEPPAVAIDPICGMSVTIAGAKHTYEYQGTTYYFCCPGCKTTFRKAPEQYVAAGRVALSVK